MGTGNWRELAEILGIAAIVASLVFVGMQLRQEQEIALAEIFDASESSAAAIDFQINENTVITSYSIHYTKLYDPRPTAT